MKTIKEIADSIYSYCVYAMDYDMMGLSFDASSLISAINGQREEIADYNEEKFNTLKGYLSDKVLSLYEKNKNASDALKEEAQTDVVKKMRYTEVLDEMIEAKKFMQYLDKELDYAYFKMIVE